MDYSICPLCGGQPAPSRVTLKRRLPPEALAVARVEIGNEAAALREAVAREQRGVAELQAELEAACASPTHVFPLPLMLLSGRVENVMKKLRMQSWAIPRYSFYYGFNREKEAINNMIEKAISQADKKRAKVVSLGLLNQAHRLNGSGELYLQKYLKLGVRLVDGTSFSCCSGCQ